MRSAQIASDLNRDYEAVLDFVQEVQDRCSDLEDFTLSEVYEADEIYVTADEKAMLKSLQPSSFLSDHLSHDFALVDHWVTLLDLLIDTNSDG